MDAVRRLFLALPAHDQRHLIAVHGRCQMAGLADKTCLSGLLHDIGKASLAGRGIPVVVRIWQVVRPAARGAGSNSAITARNLAANHAQIGADRLRALGVDERVCWLVEHHDDSIVGDPELDQLRVIDNSTP